MYVITKLIVLLTTIPGIVGPLADTWASCECEFLTWAPWSDCTELCYGTQERDRKVQLRQYPGCDEFTDCASSDMGSEQRECNKFCHNGGTFASLSTGCSCVPGKEGRCCDNTVTCAPPPKPTNGEVSYNSLDYGSTATYSCHSDYNITSGSSSRTCQANGGWNGVTAQCQYVNTCSSNPCKNGGSCINGVESYTCQCQPGWSGINCENDVHPPVMTECSEDILIYTNETTHNVTWPIPQFSDPMNKEITMVTNYPESFVVAPWGDNVVQYVATKPFNGLQAECKFTVKVRPHPCPELNIPINGARVCNGWKTEYARVCLVYCNIEFTLQLGSRSPQPWYICGASGNWLPWGSLPNCTLPNVKGNFPVNYQYENCTAIAIKESYINRLKNESNIKVLCDKNLDECKADNVNVDC